ncbi:MAG TPA: hypothetical protein VFZ93_08885, partial [Albitalea sp.]
MASTPIAPCRRLPARDASAARRAAARRAAAGGRFAREAHRLRRAVAARSGEVAGTRHGRRVAHAGVAGVRGVPGPVHRAQREAHRLHAALLQVLHDRAVAGGHRRGHRLAELAREQLAAVGVRRHGLHGAKDGVAERLAAQRVAFLVGRAEAQHRAHVAGELAQLPFARVRDLLA